MSTAGLVLGITGLVFYFILYPFLSYFIAQLMLPLAVVGLPLSGAAFYRARTDGTSRIIPLAGLATNAVALVLSSFVGLYLWVWLYGIPWGSPY